MALFALAWSRVHGDGYGAIWILRLLALSVMIMMFGLFSFHWLAGSGDIERMARGVIICTFAVSLFSLRGSRELMVFFRAAATGHAGGHVFSWAVGVDDHRYPV